MSNLLNRLQRLELAARTAPLSVAERRARLLGLMGTLERKRHADLRRRGAPIPRSLMPRLREQPADYLFEVAGAVLAKERKRREGAMPQGSR